MIEAGHGVIIVSGNTSRGKAILLVLRRPKPSIMM
jgi:hypothetical protein